MKYWVIWSDGQKFGPADVDTLNQWIAEGRVDANTELEDADTGTRLSASSLAGLVFPAKATPQAAQPGPASVETPTQAATPYGTAGPIGQAPITESPYPRASYNPMIVPAELTGKFNFGAFALTWIWGLNHKAYITLVALGLGLLSMVPTVGCLASVASLALSIWFGLKGNEWAWQSGRFATPEECISCQRVWMWWGIAVFALSIVVGLLAAMAGVAAVMTGMAGGMPQ